MKNDTMILIYRIVFFILLLGFIGTSALGLSGRAIFVNISLFVGVITILTWILVLFEIQEDYFNKKIDKIIEVYEFIKKPEGDEQNGTKENILKQSTGES